MYFIQECAWLSVCFCDRGGEKDRRGESSVLSLLHPGIFELALTAEAQLFPRQSEIKPLTRTKYSPHYSTKNDQKKNKSTVWRGCVDAALFLEWICPGAETFPPCLEHFAQRRKVSDEPSTQQRSKNLLCSLSSSSFDCYCRFKKNILIHLNFTLITSKVVQKCFWSRNMELQCLQEALKVEIQCHQVKTKHRFILPLICGLLSEWVV